MVAQESSGKIQKLYNYNSRHCMQTHFEADCSSVKEVEREDVICSPGHAESEGVRGEGEVEGNGRGRDQRGL